VMIPPKRANAATLPTCLVNVIVPNGVAQTFGNYSTTAALSPAGYAAFTPLVPHSDYTSVLQIQNHQEGAAHDRFACGGHTPVNMTWMNGTLPTAMSSNGRCTPMAKTFDQVIGDALPGSKFNSLSMHLGPDGGVGDAGAGCPGTDGNKSFGIGPDCSWFSNNMFWSDNSTPVNYYTEPQTLFNDMFGSGTGMSSTQTQAAATARKNLATSILNKVTSARQRLAKQVSKNDQIILDQYYTSLQDLQTRVQTWDQQTSMMMSCSPATPITSGSSMYPPTSQFGNLNSANYAARNELYLDLIVKAIECDLTHVMNLVMGSEATKVNSFIGSAITSDTDWHGVSHQGPNSAQYIAITAWMFQNFGKLVQRLSQNTDAGGGRLLDRTIAMLHYPLCEGWSHNNDWNQILIAGGSSAGLKMGKDINYTSKQPSHAQLWLTIMKQMMGGKAPATYGDNGTSVLTELTT
jgi:hypothetical protein